MALLIVTIADSLNLARAIDHYLMARLRPKPDHRFMIYGECGTLSGDLCGNADLFILELFRQDHLGFRAEGVPAAKIWAGAGKRVLIVSGSAKADAIGASAYWDLGANDSLAERVEMILGKPPAPCCDFDRVAAAFKRCSRLPTPHPSA